MVMQMLHAGGLVCATDGARAADADNPRGYFEVERVKQLDAGDEGGWLRAHRGQAIKVISFLLPRLPDDLRYRVLFVRRSMAEVLASQRQMLVRRGQDDDAIDDDALAASFETHLRQVEAHLRATPAFETLFLDHGDVVANPGEAARAMHRFLGGDLDEAAMAGAVDASLYRNRETPS